MPSGIRYADAQDYVNTPVSISKEKVKINGQICYSHVVLERQTLFSISKAYNVSVEDIYKYNPSVKQSGLVKNSIIIIPVAEETVVKEEAPKQVETEAPVQESVQKAEKEPVKKETAKKKKKTHTVKWYESIDDIAANFHVRGDGSPEKIFELNLVYDASLSGYTQHSQANMSWMWNWRQSRVYIPTGVGAITYNNGWGGVNPSQKFIDILLENDGYDSARRKAWVASYDEVLYEMPYPQDGDAPVLGYSDAKAADKNRGVYHADGVYAHCGWFMMKVNINAEDIKNSNNERNTRIFRYPEVIFMFAECATQTGQDKELALQLVQAIQNRAKSKTVWSSVADVTLENIKKEKLIEMWLEGCRYQDLVRWGDTDELMNNGKVIPNFKDKINEGNATHEGYVDYSDADWCIKLYPELGFKKGKHELFPFPFSETSVNENIKQNPGWE